MTEYGYINDGGYLVSRFIEEQVEKYKDTDGKIKMRVISIEMQIEKLAQHGWKPVDPIDESAMQCADGYTVRITPYDAGNRISYKYETVFDTQKVFREIQSLKDQLTSSDYKVIKCYEASLTRAALPYDIDELHSQRQAIRNRINELEATI
ncbi:MAG: hypothetical protein LIO77_03055 [Rikenellaceae bacterium]|jgi:cell division protein FtsB|nr:hypothetical protein [Rikenellaceae bacterium]MCC8038845.1 hypothetical protein [Bacteroidales bacterium]